MSQEPTDAERQIAHAMQQIASVIQDYAELMVSKGVPKQVFLSSALFAIATISKDLGMPTAVLGMALSRARQTVDDNAAKNANPN